MFTTVQNVFTCSMKNEYCMIAHVVILQTCMQSHNPNKLNINYLFIS